MLGSGGTGKVHVDTKDDGTNVVRKQAFRDVQGAQDELDNQERTYRRLRHAPGYVSHMSEFIEAGRIPDGNKFIQVQHLPNATDLYNILRSDALTIRNNWHEIAESIINAVMWMHDNRTAHGDIKPANILIVPSEGGKPGVRLIDFGYSTTPEDGPVNVLGTALYMPPELLKKSELDKMIKESKIKETFLPIRDIAATLKRPCELEFEPFLKNAYPPERVILDLPPPNVRAP